MHKDELGTEWVRYVRRNYSNLKKAVDEISRERELLTIRSIMSKMGHEMTPDELRQLAELLQKTLEIVENNLDSNL